MESLQSKWKYSLQKDSKFNINQENQDQEEEQKVHIPLFMLESHKQYQSKYEKGNEQENNNQNYERIIDKDFYLHPHTYQEHFNQQQDHKDKLYKNGHILYNAKQYSDYDYYSKSYEKTKLEQTQIKEQNQDSIQRQFYNPIEFPKYYEKDYSYKQFPEYTLKTRDIHSDHNRYMERPRFNPVRENYIKKYTNFKEEKYFGDGPNNRFKYDFPQRNQENLPCDIRVSDLKGPIKYFKPRQ